MTLQFSIIFGRTVGFGILKDKGFFATGKNRSEVIEKLFKLAELV